MINVFLLHRLLFILLVVLVVHCRPKEAPKDFAFKKQTTRSASKASSFVDLENKGIGPITQVVLEVLPDSALISQGQLVYQQKCTACHKIGSTFIGPPPNGILDRRTPEWIMNMILNTEEMLQKDSLAKALFMEFNGQLMTNQNLSESEARAVIEYFRTL